MQFMRVITIGSMFIEILPSVMHESGSARFLMDKKDLPCMSGKCDKNVYAAIKKGIWMSKLKLERNAINGW